MAVLSNGRPLRFRFDCGGFGGMQPLDGAFTTRGQVRREDPVWQ